MQCASMSATQISRLFLCLFEAVYIMFYLIIFSGIFSYVEGAQNFMFLLMFDYVFLKNILKTK